MLAIRCALTMLEPDSQPPWVEARFLDAGGRTVSIRDKEPIFVRDDDAEGCGSVRCSELSRRQVGTSEVVTVSLDLPDGLETTDGRTVVEVPASSLMNN